MLVRGVRILLCCCGRRWLLSVIVTALHHGRAIVLRYQHISAIHY